MKVRVTKQWIIDTLNKAAAEGVLASCGAVVSTYSCHACAYGSLLLAALEAPPPPCEQRTSRESYDDWYQNKREPRRLLDHWGFGSIVSGGGMYGGMYLVGAQFINKHLKNERYYAALSCAFESACDKAGPNGNGTEAGLAAAVALVRSKRWPETVVLDLNGYAPAKGLEMVPE